MVAEAASVLEIPDPWPGVKASWRRTLSVPSTSAVDSPGTRHEWHFLDNAADVAATVAATGVQPAGTLLCVHGNPTWSYLWRTLLSGATTGATATTGPWRVIAVDQLDMGFSERTGTFRRLEDRITDLGDLTNALGLTGPVVTVGHDWGGIISLGWATRHRDELAGVVLTNTAVHPAGFSLPPALKLALHPAVHGWGTTTTSAFLRVTHGLAQPPLTPDVRAAFMAPYRSVSRRAGVGNFVADIPATSSHPSWSALDEVSSGIQTLGVPALMMWGPKDPIFSDRYLRDLIHRLPQADVHRFEGASHLVQEDRDIATPTFDWLAKNLVGRGHVPAIPEATREAAYSPMLAELDARCEDTSVAIVDMAPGSASKVSNTLVNRSASWAELARDVDDLAAGLADLGVTAGKRVSLLVPPGITLTTLIYACLRLGAVILVADAGLGTQGMSRAIKGAGPDFLVGIERALAGARLYNWPGIRISSVDFPGVTGSSKRALFNVAATVPEIMAKGSVLRRSNPASAFTPAAPDDDAAVLFTSGSTGPAKGVVYTHRRLAAMRDTLKATYALKAGTGLVAGFAPFALLGPALGATSVTPDMDVTSPRTLTAAALAAAAAAIDATVVFASPAAMVNVVASEAHLTPEHRTALARVELVLSAGAPLSEPLLAEVAQLAPNAAIHTPYGMTEALPVTDISLDGIREAGVGNGVCVGKAVSGAVVAITALNPDGTPTLEPSTAPGITGEILVAAPHVKARYDRLWITQEHSAAIPGWHRSGDVGHFDDAGRLWVEGRLAHVITTPAGVRTPVAGEQAAERLPEVSRAAVVGVGPVGTAAAVVIVETVPQTKRAGLADTALAAAVRSAARTVDLEVAAVLCIPEMPTDIRHNSKIDRAKLAVWASRLLSGGRAGKP
ncbi:alpha/beta fold hydrolase [Arthrobacter cryoconiti]|uniref:Alpha/beta fold hydrolase n=1 Tax=Arthrobacter cryoconiti TaxID=748907 RepID=A0ABV8QWF5_9MICC|nr:alpha/beta fold hydrolase [Arthrobacter cryoconiti]MCC9068741.1 alpha/beta fold hydrolase [Arthrobacter cryoconiti]